MARPSSSTRTRFSRVWRRLRRGVRWIALRTIGVAGPPFLSLLAKSWRIELRDEMHLAHGEAAGGMLLTLWHGRMMLGMIPHRNRGYSVLVSHSKDGELVHRVLRRIGYGSIRGSSSRGAPRAVREMLRDLRAGRYVVVTPDGPRGPRHAMNDGVAWMARATGYPVVPIGLGAARAWVFNSWDAFAVPKPFSRVVVVYGAPMYVERGATDEAMRNFATTLQETMLALELQADALASEPSANAADTR